MEKVRKISKKYYLRQIVACWLMCWMVFGTSIALATPSGGAFTVGTGVINDGVVGGDNTVLVNQAASVIEWGGLGWGGIDTSSSESLTFSQLAGLSNSAVLNNIKSGNVTQFNGTLNGVDMRIFIVNDAGIIFGNGAIINATQLVASSLNISNEDFTNGIYQFSGGGIGEVANYGQISAEQVALIGRKVLNAGVIRSPNGYVLMAAGDRVFLGTKGSGVVVEVSSVTVPDVPAVEGMGDVINEGTIEAAGGKIVLAAGDTFSRAIEGLDGLTVAVESGTGRVGQFGTLNADGVDGDGGSITLTAGDEVVLGGDSLTTANAGVNGDGGEVIAYSPDTVLFSEGAKIEARGGIESGDGGFVEISGLEDFVLAGFADLRAPAGQAGLFLLDPHNVWISDNPGSSSNVNTTWLAFQLGMGNFLVNTDGPGIGLGDITVQDAVSWASIYGLRLNAARDIYVGDSITNTGTGYLRLKANRHIIVDAPIFLNGGLLRILAGQNDGPAGLRINDDLTAGSMFIKNGRTFANEATNSWIDVADGAKLTSTAGNISIEAVHDIILGNGEGGVVVDAAGNLWINADRQGQSGHGFGGDIVTNAALIAGGSVGLWANAMYLGGNVSANGGNLQITGRTSRDNNPFTGGPPSDGTSMGSGNGSGINVNWGNIDVASGGTLYASGNLSIINDGPGTMKLRGHDSLSLIAGGAISTSDTSIGVTGSSLLMQQGPSINTAAYTFFNQGTTDLTLISDTGSVTSTTGANAANKWKSIGAHADDNITLARSNGKNEITLGDSGTAGKSLIADNGYIDIDGFNVENSVDFADWNLEAGTTLSIDVVHGIDLGGDLSSGSNMELLADTDTRYGHDVTVAGSINSGGTLNIEGTNVDIRSAHSAGNMDIYAHGLYDKTTPPDEPLIASGDVHVHGALTTTDGHIIIEATDFGPGGATTGPTFASPGDAPYSATGTIYLHDNVTANGSDSGDDVRLLSNTVASDNIKIKAYDDVYLKNDKSITGLGDLYVESGDNIELGSYDELNPLGGGSGGEVTTAGNLDMDAGGSVYAYGKLMTTGTAGFIGNGDLTVHAGDDIYLYAVPESARAEGILELLANQDDIGGVLDVAGDLYGNMKLYGYDVTVDGTVTSLGILDVDADDNIRLKKNVSSVGDMTMDAGDNITLNENSGDTTSGARMRLIAGDDITIGKSGNEGNVTANGNMKIWAGNGMYDDVTAWGKLTTTNGGNIDVRAGDDITIYGTQYAEYESVEADGTLSLVADTSGSGDDGGNLTVHGNVVGNMYMSGTNVTVEGTVTSNGILDVDADDNIRLKKNVSSVGDMTMDALSGDITLNQNAGDTTSGARMRLLAGDDITIGQGGDNFGNVTANGNMKIWAGNEWKDDVKIYGKLTTTNDGWIDVRAGDDITIYGTQYAEYESIEADGTLTLIADTSGNGQYGGDLYVAGNVIGNMYMSGTDVTVDGTVTSLGTLDVDADDDITLKKNVSSVGAMTMNAGDNIRLNEDGDYTSSGGTMMLNAGLAYDGSLELDILDWDEMSGSIKIEGYASSKDDMTMNATGGGIVLYDDGLLGENDVMSGSIYIQDYAYSLGEMTMTAVGGDEFATVEGYFADYSEIVFMNGSIKIGDYAESKYNMLMTATGGSEGIDLYDVLDFDGMNGSIKIGNDAKSKYGSLTMTAEGGSEYLTNDETDIDLMNGSIKIGDDVTSLLSMNLTAKGGHELLTVDGLDVDGMNGSILIGDDAKSYLGNVTMTAEGGSEILTKDCLDIAGMSGSIKIGGDVTSLFHLDLSAKGGSEIGTVDKYDIDGMNGSIWIEGNAKSYLDGVTMTAEGGSEILTYDEWDVDGMNGSIKIDGDVTATSNMDLSAKGGSDILTADKFDIDGMNGSIKIGDDAKSLFGSMTMTAEGGSEFLSADCVDIDGMNGSIKIGDDVTSMFSMNLSAKGGSEIGTLDKFDIDMMNGSIKIGGDAESWFGGVTMTAEGGKEILSADLVDFDLMNGSIKIGGHVKSKYDLELTAKGGYEFLTVDGFDFDLMNGSICIGDYVRSGHGAVTLTAEGTSEVLTYDGLDIDLMNGSIFVGGYIESQDDTIISAQGGDEIWAGNHHDFSLLSGDVVVLGDIQSYGGNVEIYSSDDTTYLGGDVTAYDSVLLNNNTKFIGFGDQHVTAQTGTITAHGWLDKRPIPLLCFGWTDGSLYLQANGDIRLDDYVKAAYDYCYACLGGGVSIISDTGTIGSFGGDVLNVDITGRSDHKAGVGVILPYDPEGPGRAAIVIMSKEDLKLGSGGELNAYGRYYDDGSVDDRFGINFLNVDPPAPPAEIPAGTPRDAGDRFDVAIYVASTGTDTLAGQGNVDVSAPVTIRSLDERGLECVLGKGAMVIDAYDTVTFDGGVPGGLFEASLTGDGTTSNVGSRLEVVSRRSEWLEEAVGRLPYVFGGGPFVPGYNYVLRGAGADNPAIGDGAPAWVLENIPSEAAPLGQPQLPTIEGCPAETQAAAAELGITPETIQVAMGEALALNPDIHPCEACARLIDAARILSDEDGSRMAAMVEAFNTLAPADAPFTPEMGASIAMAFEDAAEGTQYASIAEYIDAFVQYIAVLDTELGSPVPDSVAFVMGKYGTGITEDANPNLAAFVATRLEGGGTFRGL